MRKRRSPDTAVAGYFTDLAVCTPLLVQVVTVPVTLADTVKVNFCVAVPTVFVAVMHSV
jgi:hypothetical protein